MPLVEGKFPVYRQNNRVQIYEFSLEDATMRSCNNNNNNNNKSHKQRRIKIA